MRRDEFQVEDQAEIESFLHEMTFGFLGTIGEDGFPRATPINFVYQQGVFYMHSSRKGEKVEHIAGNNKASFTVAKEFAIIPSYFTHPVLACPASAFFKSVMAKGTIELVSEAEEKAIALQGFMNKLQPEGGFEPIAHDHPKYIGQLKAVNVLRFTPDQLTAKFKFGQNLAESRRTMVTEGLERRDAPLDAETIALMKKYCPHAKEKQEDPS